MATRKKSLANKGQIAQRVQSTSPIKTGTYQMSQQELASRVGSQPHTGGQIGAAKPTASQLANRTSAPVVVGMGGKVVTPAKNKGQAQSSMVKRRNMARKAVKGTKATSASSAFMMKKKKP